MWAKAGGGGGGAGGQWRAHARRRDPNTWKMRAARLRCQFVQKGGVNFGSLLGPHRGVLRRGGPGRARATAKGGRVGSEQLVMWT